MGHIENVEDRIDVYKNSNIVLWGAGFEGYNFISKMSLYDVNIIAICDNNTALHGKKLEGIPIISPDELKLLCNDDTSIVVQITLWLKPEIEEQLLSQIKDLGVKKYIPFDGVDIQFMFSYIKQYNSLNSNIIFKGSDEYKKIPVTQIDSQLSIYKNNKVILCGVGLPCNILLDLFKHYEIDIFAIYDYENNVQTNENYINIDCNLYIDSAEELENIIKKEKNILLQMSNENIVVDDINPLKCLSSEISNISYREAFLVLNYIRRCNIKIEKTCNTTTDNNIEILPEKNNDDIKEGLLEYIDEHKDNSKDLIFICMLGKTGDFTLQNTFNKNNVNYYNIWHSPQNFSKDMFKNISENIKIITALREPISQELSTVYQLIGDLNHHIFSLNKLLYPFEEDVIWKNGGDVQYIFDRRMDIVTRFNGDTTVEVFMNDFTKHILDIRKDGFDTKKGYSIVKDGNIQVFTYQLEKMNDLIPEISEFVGVEFDKWELGNTGSDKWVGNSYKQAQKEIKVDAEYFNKCYDDSYIKHCYSSEDIEKFKNRWKNQIKN